MGIEWQEVLDVLVEVHRTIHAWYRSPESWRDYNANAPEMKRLNAMIENVRGMIPYKPDKEAR